MTSDPVKPPTNISHLRILLDKWSKDPDEPVLVGRLQRLVGVTAVVAMLDGMVDDEGEPMISFKGGTSLELRFGLSARASRDLDAAIAGDMANAGRLIGERLALGWNGFVGRIDEWERVERAMTEPKPLRTKIRLTYLNKPFMTLPFEIGAAEGESVSGAERLPSQLSLARVRLPDVDDIPFIPVRYQIAQKIHACTEPSTEDWANPRARDLHDLLLIEELAVTDDNLGQIRVTCVEVFASRNKHAWPPQIDVPPAWPAIWDAIEEAQGTRLDAAVTAVTDLIARIDAAQP
jgi:hypothetical protein